MLDQESHLNFAASDVRDLNSAQDAFVLTGSTANAAYEVGVMKRLLSGKWGKNNNPPIDPYCFSGTSVGALNAAAMVSNSDLGFEEAVNRLESIWLDHIAVAAARSSTGVFRLRGDFTQYFDFQLASNPFRPFMEMGSDVLHFTRETVQRLAYASATNGTFADRAVQLSEFSTWMDFTPLQQLVKEFIDTKKIGVSSRKLLITAVNWQTGIPRTFENHDISSTDGHESIISAMCLPGLFPPQVVDGLPYVDSSVLFDTPLRPAINARLKDSEIPVVLHVVYADSSFRDIPVPPLSNTFATVYRLYQLALSKAVNSDIALAHTINERIRVKNLFEAVASATEPSTDKEDVIREKLGVDAVQVWQELKGKLANQVRLTVHRYAPKQHIYGFELVQFERKTVEQLIEYGYDAARDHDCIESRCIIPEENASAIGI
jgi:predicted acylesterase/phospholipase RssA